MTYQIYHNMPMPEYQARTDFLSKSMLSCLLRNPAEYHARYVALDYVPEEKDHLNVGKALHTLIAEPHKWNLEYYVLDKSIKRDARHKAYQAALEEAGSRIVLTHSQNEAVMRMADGVSMNSEACKLMQGNTVNEASIFYEHEGRRFRCRPDILHPEGKYVVDIKTANTLEPKLWTSSAFSFSYMLSVAITLHGIRQAFSFANPEYYFVAVESGAPHFCRVFSTLDAPEGQQMSYYDVGKIALERALEKLETCSSEGVWPVYDRPEVEPMAIPSWAIDDYEATLEL